jgi:hypothetical protein
MMTPEIWIECSDYRFAFRKTPGAKADWRTLVDYETGLTSAINVVLSCNLVFPILCRWIVCLGRTFGAVKG